MSIYGTIPLVVNVKARVDEVRKSLQSVSRQVGSFARQTSATAITTPIFPPRTTQIESAKNALRELEKGAIDYQKEAQVRANELGIALQVLNKRINDHKNALRGVGSSDKILPASEVDAIVQRTEKIYRVMRQLQTLKTAEFAGHIQKMGAAMEKVRILGATTGHPLIMSLEDSLKTNARSFDTWSQSAKLSVWMVGEIIRNLPSTAGDALKRLGDRLSLTLDMFAGTNKAMGAYANILQATTNILISATSGFVGLAEVLRGNISLTEVLKGTVFGLVVGFKELGSVVIQASASLLSFVVSGIQKTINNTQQLKTVLIGVANQIQRAFVTIKNVVMALLTPIRMVTSKLASLRGEAKSAGKGFKISGTKLAWFGFRLVMVGRILSRYLTNPLKKGLGNLQNWQSGITSIGFALGFLSSQGLLSGNMMGEMQDIMMGLPETGMLLKSVLTTMGLAFLRIAQDILPILAPMLIEVADALLELWEKAGPDVLDMLDEMSKTSFPEFIRVLKDVGPAILKGVVAGLKKAIPILTKALKAITPFADRVGEMAGLLIGLAPLMTAFGFGLYFASIPLQAFVSLSSFLKGALTSLIGTFTSLSSVISIIAGLGLAILALGTAAELMGIDTNEVLDRVGEKMGAFGDTITSAIGGINWSDIFKAFSTFVGNLWDHVTVWAGSAADAALSLITSLASGLATAAGTIKWLDIWSSLKTFAGTLWEKFMTWAGSMATMFLNWVSEIKWTDIFAELKTWAGTFWENFKTWAGDATAGLKAWIDSVEWDKVWSSLVTMVGIIALTLSSILSTLGTDIAGAIEDIDWGVAFSTFISSLSSIVGRIGGAIGGSIVLGLKQVDWAGVGLWLASNIFQPLVQGGKDFLSDPIKWFQNVAKWSAENVIEPFVDGLDVSIQTLEELEEELTNVKNTATTSIGTKALFINALMANFKGSTEAAGRYGDMLSMLSEDKLREMVDSIYGSIEANDGLKGSMSAMGDILDDTTTLFESGATQINNYNIDLNDVVANAPGIVTALENIQDAVKKLGDEAEITAENMAKILGDSTAALDTTLDSATDTTSDLVDILADVSDNMDDAAGAIDNATDSLDSWTKIQDILAKDSKDLWMTSLGSDIMRNMEEATRGFEMASSAALGFNDVSTGLTAPGGGAGVGGGSPAPQYINITLNFDGVELSSDVDLDAFTQEISYRLADKLKEEMRR